LDAVVEVGQWFPMSSRPGHLHFLVLERHEAAQNMARFYVLSLEPTLFGDDIGLVREWGRLGQQGRRRVDLYADTAVATEALDTWLQRKVRRGYVMRVGSALPPSSVIEERGTDDRPPRRRSSTCCNHR
jgi:predicted DNA-binding WGR domain protein